MSSYETLRLEKYFPAQNMNLEEREIIIQILNNCKDIASTEVVPTNFKNIKGNIINLHMKKEGEYFFVNGSFSIDEMDTGYFENRWINAQIHLLENIITVDSKIQRLGIIKDDREKEYKVIDVFKKREDTFLRFSQYSTQSDVSEEIVSLEENTLNNINDFKSIH